MMFPWRSKLVAVLFPMILASSAAAQPGRPLPPPEEVNLVTRDGVELKATFFASPRTKDAAAGKQVAPVVLLHDYKSTRSSLHPLARRLQAQVHEDQPRFAVITVDLRAHGDSINQLLPGGQTVVLETSRLRRDDYLAMAAFDMEAVRTYLVGKNDEGSLNLNKLCLVGSGMGGNVAANWALRDWQAPPLAIGKQGQDVKGIVLISPTWSFDGLSFQAPMRFRPLKQNVAWLLMCGAEDPPARANMQRISKQLERFHPQPVGAAAQSNSLLALEWPSKLQGDLLVKQVGAPVEENIMKFLIEQVATRRHAWSSRRVRLP